MLCLIKFQSAAATGECVIVAAMTLQNGKKPS